MIRLMPLTSVKYCGLQWSWKWLQPVAVVEVVVGGDRKIVLPLPKGHMFRWREWTADSTNGEP